MSTKKQQGKRYHVSASALARAQCVRRGGAWSNVAPEERKHLIRMADETLRMAVVAQDVIEHGL